MFAKMTFDEFAPPLNMIKSTAWHLLLLAGLAFLLTRHLATPSDPITVEVVYPQTPSKNRVVPVPGSVRHARHHPIAKKGITLDDLGVKIDYRPQPQEQDPTSTQDAISAMTQMPGGWDLMNPDPKVARFNQYIYNVVQHQLDLESRWMQNRPIGTVKIRVWFDANGNYLESRTHYEAIDSDFRNIVARALRASFVRAIPKPYLYIKKPFYIDREVFVREF